MNLAKLSLSQRLLFAISVVLTLFLGLSAISLYNAFESSAETEQKRRLLNYVYILLTAAEMDKSGQLVLSHDLAEPKFYIPNSGLYAQISNEQGVIWQSPSAIGHSLVFPAHPIPAEEEYSLIDLPSGVTLLSLAFSIVWETESGVEKAYTLNVAEDTQLFRQQTASFQRNLWYWLGGTGLVLFIVQWGIFRWGLNPLQVVNKDLRAIETGDHRRLNEDYPAEVQQLTQNINALLDHEEARRLRYKNSLADLAHSLKTPLSVFRGELENANDLASLKQSGHEQLNRISTLVDYQLQRASTEGKGHLLAPVSLGEIVHKLVSSLDKVYLSKHIQTQCEIDRGAFLQADEGDMYEMLGNVLENACKYCRRQVHVIVRPHQNFIRVRIEDDGIGIPAAEQQRIIKRGQRIDTQAEGQGLGLAIVSDIITAYNGQISVENSHLGGACFIIDLPKR